MEFIKEQLDNIKTLPIQKLDEWHDPISNEDMIHDGKNWVCKKNTTITCEQIRKKKGEKKNVSRKNK
jgi:hypothetical protein